MSSTKNRLIASALLMFFVSNASFAQANFYVSTSGNDGPPGDGSSSNPWHTIQYAINNSSGSDITINVAEGEYVIAQNILVDKALTILGANATINPNTGTRGAETVLHGNTVSGFSNTLEIDTENVVIEGITFDNLRIDNYSIANHGNPGSTSAKLIGGITIENNLFTDVSGTALFLQDGRNAPGVYSNNVSVTNNKINATDSAGSIDFEAGSGMVIRGVENLDISGNVIIGSAYGAVQLSRNSVMTIAGNTATGSAQPALQIAEWNDSINTISNNTFSTVSIAKAAVRLYGFTNNYYPLFNFRNNVIRDSKYGVQIGYEGSGKGYNDLTNAEYDFTGNAFINISSQNLIVYLGSAATVANVTEMDSLFSQIYGAGNNSRALTIADPFTYVVNTLYVGPGKEFTTIQAAITAAGPGGTIHIASGTYVEAGQIVIAKNLTIIGADKTSTIIKPAQGTSSASLDNSSAWILVNAGVTFYLSGVTLDGAGQLISNGILSHGLGTIDGNIIEDIAYNESGPDYSGDGLALYGASMTVSNNNFSGMGREGVFAAFFSTATITGNTYTGKGAGNWLDFAFEVGGNSRATISANTVSGNIGVALSDGSTSAGAVISTHNDVLPGTTSGATITNNTFTGNTKGIEVGVDASDSSVVIANNNTITGNSYGVISTHSAINAENNWWGSNTGPYNAATNTTGTGDAVSDYVDYTPWLSALPVELTSFTASLNNNAVELDWRTATEINNYGYEVERSMLASINQTISPTATSSWKKIAFVQGSGTSNEPRKYSYIDNTAANGRYVYRLEQIDNNGMFKESQELEVEVTAVPKEYLLNQNYPNPFNPATTISYQIPKDAHVTIKIFDANGREVTTPVEEFKPAGQYSVIFDASRLASGIYFYSIRSGDYSAVKKMALIK